MLRKCKSYIWECMLVAQSCPTLCDTMDCCPPGSSVHGILQANILEWAAISSSMGSSWPRDGTQVSLLQPNTLPSEPPGKSYIWQGVRLMPSFRTVITVWGANGIPGKKILLLSVGVSQIGLASVCGKVDSVSSEPAHFPTCKVKMKVVPDSLLSHGLYSPPGSSVHGILQARILEWVAIPFSRGSSQPRDWTQISHIAGRSFTIWATREALLHGKPPNTLLKMQTTLI